MIPKNWKQHKYYLSTGDLPNDVPSPERTPAAVKGNDEPSVRQHRAYPVKQRSGRKCVTWIKANNRGYWRDSNATRLVSLKEDQDTGLSRLHDTKNS